MDIKDARRLAAEHIREGEPRTEGFTPVIVDLATQETTFAWIFFYDSEEYLRTGELQCALAGNAPIVVTKVTGKVYETGTAKPLSEYLAAISDAEQIRDGMK